MNAPSTFAAEIGRGEIETVEQYGLTQHVAIFLADRRVLSDETFRLVKFTGQEQISGPFEFQLELHARTQPGEALNFGFEDILSRPVTVGIDLPGAKDTDFARAIKGGASDHLSWWNGIVANFAMGVPGVYHLTMRPALWTLSLTNRYQIHRQLSIRGAIEQVLSDHGVIIGYQEGGSQNSASLSAISGSDNPAVTRVQDWLQAGESDLDFIQRLMQKAHIFYYFEHHATYHSVVFANRPAYPDVLEDGRSLRYAETGEDPLGLDQDDLVLDYRYSQTMTSTGVSGVLARQEAAWEEDTVARFDTYRAQSDTQLGALPYQRFQVCQYGGSDGEIRWDTKTCDDTRSTSAIALAGGSTCPTMRPGYCFTLEYAGTPDVEPYPIRPTLGGQRFVLSQVQHNADLGGTYRNQFHATAAVGLVAPFSIQDTQQGVVLAQVVKHDNGIDPKDWRYYQRSAFDPETDKLKDSSANPTILRPKGVYVRFATDTEDTPPVWVKLAPHMLTTPELGVSVLVTRASDHSELPEIQSIVQSNGHTTVTPSGWTANTAVGSNYSTNYGDSRGVRFGLNSHGQLTPAKTWVDDKYNNGDSNVPGWFSGVHLRDVSWSKGGSASYSTAEGGRDDVLSESWSVGSTYSQHHAKETKGISKVDHSWNQSTGISSYSDNSISATAESISSIGTSKSTSTVGTSISNAEIGVSTQSSLTGISNVNSTTSISNANSATGMRLDLSVTGMANSVNATGMANSVNVTGMANSVSATGMANSESATGMANSVNVTGMANSVSTTGMANSESATGMANSVNVTSMANSLNSTGETGTLSYIESQLELSSITAQMQISKILGTVQVTTYGGGFQVSNAEAVLKTKLTGMTADIVSMLQVIL
jgi:uncharacterized protein involved in type VI secretion and phage assembly